MRLIAFEGLDGSGKSTLIQEISAKLTTKGQTVVITREPGGTPLGDEIRHLLLRTTGDAPVPRAELLLYEAARAQHVERVIRPALAEKKWVLCDRYTASSVAFQAGGRTLPRENIDWLNEFATDHVHPDLWVLLDLSAEDAFRRMEGRKLDRFEREARDFHERVRAGYLALARENSTRWVVLDARQPAVELCSQLVVEFKNRGWWS